MGIDLKSILSEETGDIDLEKAKPVLDQLIADYRYLKRMYNQSAKNQGQESLKQMGV